MAVGTNAPRSIGALMVWYPFESGPLTCHSSPWSMRFASKTSPTIEKRPSAPGLFTADATSGCAPAKAENGNRYMPVPAPVPGKPHKCGAIVDPADHHSGIVDAVGIRAARVRVVGGGK